MGALVSVCYAAAFSDKVASLNLIEGLAPLSEATRHTADRLRQGIQSRQRYRARAQQREGRSMATFKQAIDLRCSVNDLQPEQIQPLVERAVYQRDGRWYWRHDNRLRCDSLYRMSPEHVEALVAAVNCPVLSIVGQNGYQQLKLQQPSLGWQHLEQVEVAGGHHCHLQSPEKVAEVIVSFSSKFNALAQ